MQLIINITRRADGLLSVMMAIPTQHCCKAEYAVAQAVMQSVDEKFKQISAEFGIPVQCTKEPSITFPLPNNPKTS